MDAFSDGFITNINNNNDNNNALEHKTSVTNNTRVLVRGVIPHQFYSLSNHHDESSITPPSFSTSLTPTMTTNQHRSDLQNDKSTSILKQNVEYAKYQYQGSKRNRAHAAVQSATPPTSQRKSHRRRDTKELGDTVLIMDQMESTPDQLSSSLTDHQKRKKNSSKLGMCDYFDFLCYPSIQNKSSGRKDDENDDCDMGTRRYFINRCKSYTSYFLYFFLISMTLLLGFLLLSIVSSMIVNVLSLWGFVSIVNHSFEDEGYKYAPEVPSPVGKLKTKLKSSLSNDEITSKSTATTTQDEEENEEGDDENVDAQRYNKHQKPALAKKQILVKSLDLKNYETKSRNDKNTPAALVKDFVGSVEYFLNEKEDLIIEYDVKRYFGYDPDMIEFIGTDYACCCKTDFLNFCGNEDGFLKEFDYKFSYIILKDPTTVASSSSTQFLKEHNKEEEEEEGKWKLIVYVNNVLLRSSILECHFIGTIFTIDTKTKTKEIVDTNHQPPNDKKPEHSLPSSEKSLKRTMS